MTLTLMPMIFNLGPTELIILLVIVLLLFGGSRLAGLGKSSGRALKEFKEETRGLRDQKDNAAEPTTPPAVPPASPQITDGQPGPVPPTYQQPPQQQPQYPQQTPNNLADPSPTDVHKDA